MDPQTTRNQLNSSLNPDQGAADVSGNKQTSGNVDKTTTDSRNTQPANRQPHYAGGFTIIPPNEARRSQMKTMAQKEEEDLQRWKEANRPTAVQLNPERLGGNVSLSEAREKQLTAHRCSKLQKKLKKEELDKKRRQEEDEQWQKKKDEQREKAERLERRQQQEDQRRKAEFRQDHLRSTEAFLQGFERRAASSSATPTSSRGEDVESKQREKELRRSEGEVQLEHRRVNSDFLDKLEGRARASETKKEAERPSVATEGLKPETTTGHVHLPHLKPEQSWTEGADVEPDYDWALMKLTNRFPDCNKSFLEDILQQCNGDYEEALMLLICSLS